MGVAVIARGVISALGEGEEALGVTNPGEPARSRVERDEELAAAGLGKPFAARARLPGAGEEDRATGLLDHALSSCARELDEVLPGWRALRVGAAIGTSSGGMRSFERVHDALAAGEAILPSDLLGATYIGPLARAARPVAFEPVSLVLGACASSTLAIGVARSWLLADRCDVVLCGGFDAVSTFVAAGFESLRATSGPRGPRPFREGRDGLALGEAAAILALVCEPTARRASRVHGWITGFGATCDATHLTAPDAEGEGLGRAATAAIRDAGEPTIDLVSAHGTATPQNDAAEAKAIVAALGARSRDVPVYSLKGAVGHTLGAAGALEVLSALCAMERGVAPASVGEGAAEAGLRLLDRGEPLAARSALKLSSAFGGANGALALGVERAVPIDRASRAVFVSTASVAGLADTDPTLLAQRTGYGTDRIARADDLVRLTLAATASLAERLGGRDALRGAGVIVGHGLATLETNARFWSRIRAAGVSRAEPRRFPYTSPNACAGECAVAFGLTGPAFAVGGGAHGGIEALGVASDLIRSGTTDRVVVVAVDEVGEAIGRLVPAEASSSGAVALLVSSEPRIEPSARLETHSVRLEAESIPVEHSAFSAHRALLPLANGTPKEVSAKSPCGGVAKARFLWL